jgi:hypothetical protein
VIKTKQQLQQELSANGEIEIIEWIASSKDKDCSLDFHPGSKILIPEAFGSDLDETIIIEKFIQLEVTDATLHFSIEEKD